MKSKKRKMIKRVIYYSLAIVLFLILAPTVILWALGYRMDLKNYKITQTGMLFIKTDQSDFDVLVDGKKSFSNHKNITIKNLLPKDYSVKIEKQGFYTWSKSITIDPQKISREENIILFPNNLKPEKAFTDAFAYKISPDESTIVAISNDKNKLEKIDPKDKTISNEVKVNDIEYFEPSNNGNKILVKQGQPENRFIIVDLEKNGEINELSNEPDKFNRISWLPNNNQTLFLIYNNSLYKTNVGVHPIAFSLLKPDVLDFEFADDQIFYLQTDHNENGQASTLSLWQANLALDNPQELIKDLSPVSYQIIPSPDSRKIILKDNTTKIIYQVSGGKLKELNDSIKDVAWDSASQRFLSHSDYEIWLSEIKGNSTNTNLVNRYSEKIDNLSWYPDEHHIFFTIGNKLVITEEDGTNLIDLANFQVLNQNVSLIQNRGNINIFFLNKKEGDQKINLYNLNIKTP